MLILVMITSVLVINNKAGQKPKASVECSPCTKGQVDGPKCKGQDMVTYTCETFGENEGGCWKESERISNHPDCVAVGCNHCDGKTCQNVSSGGSSAGANTTDIFFCSQLSCTCEETSCVLAKRCDNDNAIHTVTKSGVITDACSVIPPDANGQRLIDYNGKKLPCSCFAYQIDWVNGSELKGYTMKGGNADTCAVDTSTPTPTPTPTLTPTPTRTPTPTTPPGQPTNTPVPTATSTPGSLAALIPVLCGTKSCDNATNPCRSGYICVQANDGSNYCTSPDFQAACKANPSYNNCCTAPGAPTATPTEIILAKVSTSPTAVVLLQTGVVKSFMYFIPAIIVLLGLIL